jgi:CRP/FNR family cyclic AMP-dependent transcriptional regulator
MMTITVQTLSQLPFFARLDDNTPREIVPHIQERTCSPGQVVLLEGDPCRAVYFIVRGLVRTCRTSLEGREHVLAYLGPGESFGLVPALDGGPHLSSVDAVTDTTLYTIPCERFRRIVREHHEVTLAVMEHIWRPRCGV